MIHLFRPYILLLFAAIGVMYMTACAQTATLQTKGADAEMKNKAVVANNPAATSAQPTPSSDPNNTGGWILNEELSDEFDGDRLDPDRWFVEGQNGDYYIWKGRAPSQFVPHNVIVSDGSLKIRTQWEPDYPYDKDGYKESGGEAYGKWKGEDVPVTTAGIITNKRFLYGYMEVKSKAPCAAMTAAFWAIGYEQELDIFEQLGAPTVKGSITANTTRTGIHDWSPPAVRPTKAFGYDEHNLPYKTCEEFHIYGAEWGEDYLKVYRDGKLTATFTQDELGTDWVLNNPMEIWLDSEVFNWLGVPHEEELPAFFEVEYMRVWQKPNDNLLDRAFYGFEGPILYEDQPKPLTLLPESSVPDDYQKFWLIDSLSAKYFVINEGQYTKGVNSLEFAGFGKNEKLEIDKVVALSPEGALNIPAGDYTISMNVWLAQGRAVDKFYISLKDAQVEIPIDLSDLARREWITIEKKITLPVSSTSMDQFKIEVRAEDIPKKKPTKFYVDEISIRKS